MAHAIYKITICSTTTNGTITSGGNISTTNGNISTTNGSMSGEGISSPTTVAAMGNISGALNQAQLCHALELVVNLVHHICGFYMLVWMQVGLAV